MWSTLKIRSGAQIGHVKWDIPAFDTVLFRSNLSSLRRKYLSDVPTDKIVLSCRPKISKCHFRFVERFLAANNCTESAEGALVPVFFRITLWPKKGLPVSPPGLFQCRTLSFDLVVLVSAGTGYLLTVLLPVLPEVTGNDIQMISDLVVTREEVGVEVGSGGVQKLVK